MILRKELLNKTTPEIRTSILFLERALFMFDVFVVAANKDDLESLQKFEERQKIKVSKPSWIKQVSEGTGIIFFVTSGHFKRKTNPSIDWSLLDLKTFLKQCKTAALNFDSITKNETVDAFFIGQKQLIEKETDSI